MKKRNEKALQKLEQKVHDNELNKKITTDTKKHISNKEDAEIDIYEQLDIARK